MRKWYFDISPRPQRVSRSGSVASASRSQITARRLPERADQVLALGKVDPGLATDRGIDHAEQRRRHVHHRGSPMPRSGREAGDVGDHAAADADHHVATGQSLAGEPTHQRLDRGKRLRCLAVADHVGLDVVVGQRDRQRDVVLGDHGDTPRRRRRAAPASSRDRPAPDHHVVGADRRAERSRAASQHRLGNVVGGAVVDRDDGIGDLLVERCTHIVQPTQRSLGVVVEQRPVHAVANTIDKHLDIGQQPNDLCVGASQRRSVDAR